eukprot:scaffold9044_cov137-Skeletonema_marinoi.AAC.5
MQPDWMSVTMVVVVCTLVQSGGIIMNETMESKVVALGEMQSDLMSITMVMAVVCALLQSSVGI